MRGTAVRSDGTTCKLGGSHAPRVEKEDSLNSEQSTAVAKERQPPPTTDEIETDLQELSPLEEDPSEELEVRMGTEIPTKPTPTREVDTPYCPAMLIEAEPEPEVKSSSMEMEIKVGTNSRTDSSNKRQGRTETIPSSSSSTWFQGPSTGTELTQRSENQIELTRTMVRLRSLQCRMIMITERYTAEMERLQEQQEECTAALWQQQQLQDELQAKCTRAISQEMSSNDQPGRALLMAKSEEASTKRRSAR